MKTIKAYGLWSPLNKDIALWSLYLTRAEVRSDGNLPTLQKAGYRVIPVTISYEPPAKAKKKENK